MKITISSKLSVEQNAQQYFEKAKKARKKLEGAKKALEISKEKLKKEKEARDTKLDSIKEHHAKQAAKVKRKVEWYEKFRWFFSSEGFLVIGGRDATTNEIIIKKHTDKEDLVFHTDMAGSPFFVVKVKGKEGELAEPEELAEPTEQTLQEVADATLCFSRAWKMGLVTTPTFYVKPEQVTKEANQGEYLPKGAFMIRGKTNYITPHPDCAVGPLDDGRIMCAPESAVKRRCKEYIKLIQGKKKASDIAKIVKKRFGGDLDEIIRVLPSGGLDIKD